MKKITIVLIVFVSLTLFSNKLFSQQDSSGTLNTSDQISNQKSKDAATIENLKDESNAAKAVEKDAQQTARDASDASKQSKDALKSEKKAQKAREKADKQNVKAEKARTKSNE